jgi:cation-transporting ATPase E
MRIELTAYPIERGLSAEEVRQRIAEGRTNLAPPSASPPVRRILARNLLSPINLVFAVATAAVVAVGAHLDALFALPLVLNIIVGISEELLAKRELDRLTVLVTPKVTVRRDGQTIAIRVSEVVADDICVLEPGDQIVADGPLLDVDGLEVDESSLTGESDPVTKQVGDPVVSGTFAVAGGGVYLAERVGRESTAARLTAEAQADREAGSSIQHDLIGLLTKIGYIATPVLAIYIAVALTHHLGTLETVRGTVTAVVSVLPEGLLLLTSTRFALGALRLAKRGLVASRLDAVESIARIDVLCLDKTGTITENRLTVTDIAPFGNTNLADLEVVLGRYGASTPTPNRTVTALAQAFPANREPVVATVPFSSTRRWSGLVVRGPHGLEAWVLGAPEAFPHLGSLTATVETATQQGRRVVAIGAVDPALFGAGSHPTEPPPTQLLGVVVLDDVLRAGAADTLTYFRDQGVTLKLISGDNSDTVKALASQVGFNADSATTGDALVVLDPVQQQQVVEATQIFGRVAPLQKKAIIETLRGGGHFVAMTGDGVNDVLALRAADLGIALQEGTAAAQAVAGLVMLEGAFGKLPDAVREGRRIIDGITVGARLFLLKTFYSLTMTAGITVVALVTGSDPSYPLNPRNLSTLSTFAIGIPALILSVVGRRPDPPQGRLVPELLRLAVPAGIIAGGTALGGFYIGRDVIGATLAESRSITTLALAVAAVAFIPCSEAITGSGRQRRLGLGIAIAIGSAVMFSLVFAARPLRILYDLVPLSAGQYALATGIGCAGAALLVALTIVIRIYVVSVGARTRT